MKKNDIKCPNPKCNKLISFKNIMMFNDKELELIGISYVFRCLKCDTTFTPDMRKSKKATKKHMKSIKKVLSI